MPGSNEGRPENRKQLADKFIKFPLIIMKE